MNYEVISHNITIGVYDSFFKYYDFVCSKYPEFKRHSTEEIKLVFTEYEGSEYSIEDISTILTIRRRLKIINEL